MSGPFLATQDRRPKGGVFAASCVAAARGLQRAEWLLIGAAIPTFLFPGPWTWSGMCLIAASWVARRLGCGRWSVPVRVDRAVVLFGVALVVSLVPSIRLDYSVPKFLGTVLGLAVLYAVVNTCRDGRSVRLAIWGLLAAGAGVAGLGLVAMQAPPEKLLGDKGTYAVLPHLIRSVQTSTVVTDGINPNELAGALVLLVPLGFAVAARGDRLRWLALALSAFMTVAVLLSQSRAGVLGLLASGCVAVLVVDKRRGAIILAVLVVIALSALMLLPRPEQNLLLAVSQDPSSRVTSLADRVELWQRGLTMAIDMPLTGIGLNTFSLILPAYYQTIRQPATWFLPHVHDLYLQTLLDFGVLGLAAWLTIVAAAVAAGVRAFRRNVERHLAAGLLLGALAFGVYGLVDAVTLGAKPGVLLWVVLGLLLVLGSRASEEAPPSDTLTAMAKPPWLVWLGRNRWSWLVAGLVLAPVFLVAASLNAAVLMLHRGGALESPFLNVDLQFARTVARGPLLARVDAAQALLAHEQGDTPGEIAALTSASALGGWDPTLSLRLGDLRFTTGDRIAAVQAWRAAGALQTLLDRAGVSTADEALTWYGLAESVDPADWRAYAISGRILENTDPERAASFTAEALRRLGDQPSNSAIAQRLVDPLAPLPDAAALPASAPDADLLLRASRLLLARQDLRGALLAAQLSTQAGPQSSAAWLGLADVLDHVGRGAQAADVRARAAELP